MHKAPSVFPNRFKRALLSLSFVSALASVGFGQSLDITTLPGYGVATSASFNFNGSGGWAGWSVPAGKVVLGAKIISAGDSFSDFSVFRPASPGEAFPHYTFGASEYGWVLQDNGRGANNGVQFEVYYSDPLPGYTITKSSTLNYSGTGWGGWSAPTDGLVTGGGFNFVLGASPASSQFAGKGSVWPHYTFGANEEGWVVQNGGIASTANVWVISSTIPEPSTYAALLGLACLGVVQFRRFRNRRVA